MVMELTGIHCKTLSGYENNVAEPSLSTFAELVSLYGLSADDILETDTGEAYTEQDLQLISMMHSLDELHQEAVMVQVSALADYLKKAGGRQKDEYENIFYKVRGDDYAIAGALGYRGCLCPGRVFG